MHSDTARHLSLVCGSHQSPPGISSCELLLLLTVQLTCMDGKYNIVQCSRASWSPYGLNNNPFPFLLELSRNRSKSPPPLKELTLYKSIYDCCDGDNKHHLHRLIASNVCFIISNTPSTVYWTAYLVNLNAYAHKWRPPLSLTLRHTSVFPTPQQILLPRKQMPTFKCRANRESMARGPFTPDPHINPSTST